MLPSLIVSFLLVMCGVQDSAEIQNVRLVLPPIVRAGGSATLLCLYDLEGASLYSVQWYRGQFEFFRYVPDESPPTKVFPIPGLHVDISASNERQVTLRDIPVQISGEFSCEVTTDAPPFSASCISENLTVVDFIIDLKVPRTEYRFGEFLAANCSVTPGLRSIKLLFLWNSRPVSAQFISESSSESHLSAFLNLSTSALSVYHKFPMRGQLTCSAVTEDQYYLLGNSLFIKLQPKLGVGSAASKLKFHFAFIVYFIVKFLIIK